MLNNIKEIQSLFAVSGYEQKLCEYILKKAEPFCDECYIDKIGNVICYKKGNGDKLLINVPVSSEGLFVTHITDDCKGKFKTIGAFKAEKISGIAVRNMSGETVGVIYCDSQEVKDTDDLYIDFGASKKDDIKIKVGDVLELTPHTLTVGDNIYGTDVARCTNIAVQLKLIETLKSDYDLYFAFTVMDNIGFKGAKTAAFAIEPDLCLVCALSYTENKESDVKLSQGAVIRIKDSHIIVNKKLRDALIKNLSDNNILYQIEILTKEGLTNNEIMYLNNGILTANINLPVRGMGENLECVSSSDIKSYKKSLEAILNQG